MIAENAGLTLKNTKDEMVARINELRTAFGFTKPEGEAELVTIQKKHLLTIIAELEAQFDTSKQEVLAGEDRVLIHAATAEASIADEIAAGNVEADDFDPITDPPVTAEELAKVKEKIAASIPALLAELAAETTQSGRKKIRARLRAAGYRLSDQPKPEAAAKPAAKKKEVKSKKK
jgi:hypothetical protein